MIQHFPVVILKHRCLAADSEHKQMNGRKRASESCEAEKSWQMFLVVFGSGQQTRTSTADGGTLRPAIKSNYTQFSPFNSGNCSETPKKSKSGKKWMLSHGERFSFSREVSRDEVLPRPRSDLCSSSGSPGWRDALARIYWDRRVSERTPSSQQVNIFSVQQVSH